MKRYESKHNPAVKDISDYIHNQARDGRIHPDMLVQITNVLEGVKRTDEMISQKEQLLVQKEKELERLKSITDNSSKVARDVISESKGNLDQAVSLHKLGKFSEALKYSDIALYNIGDINSFGVKTVEQANKLYVERLELYKESVAKRDYFYNQGVINGVNAFSWVKDNPTRDFYSFFRDTLKVSDKSPENVNLIQNRLYKNLPKYLEEAQRTNHFYNEYNKYYDAMTKLQQVVNIYNIRAASSKGLKDYEEALKSCDIALEIDPTSATLVNLKNAVLKEKQAIENKKIEEEKLLVSQTQEIEKLKELLSIKEAETQEKNKLLTQKGNELASTEKVLIDKHQKETETLKALLAQKELEHQEFLARKDKEAKELEKVKNELLKKELLEILPQAYPAAKGSGYNKPFTEWDPTWYGKKVLDAGNFKAIERDLPGLREKAARIKEENLEKQARELENAKRLQEENIKKEQLLVSQTQEIEKLKEMLSIKEVETQEKNKLLTQKGNELASKEKSLIEKHQKETEALKSLLTKKEIEHQEFLARKELEKQELLRQKDRENKELLALKEKQAKELENAKRLQEENIKKEQLLSNQNKLLSDKEQRIEELKALIEKSKIENEELLANKSHIKNQIIDELREEANLKENEVVDLRLQNLEKELIAEQKEKLLIQKELELADKSLVKNQFIKEAKKLLVEKDIKFQNLLDHNAELIDQNEVLDLKMQFYDKEVKNKETEKEILLTQKQKLSFLVSQKDQEFQNLLIQKEIEQKELLLVKEMAVSEKSFEKNQVIDQLQEDITNLKQQLLDNQPIYRSIYLEDRSCQPGESLVERQMASLDLSSINLSPINHGGQNQIVGNILGNFDINHINTTHSIYPSGDGSSFDIIDAENSH